MKEMQFKKYRVRSLFSSDCHSYPLLLNPPKPYWSFNSIVNFAYGVLWTRDRHLKRCLQLEKWHRW